MISYFDSLGEASDPDDVSSARAKQALDVLASGSQAFMDLERICRRDDGDVLVITFTPERAQDSVIATEEPIAVYFPSDDSLPDVVALRDDLRSPRRSGSARRD